MTNLEKDQAIYQAMCEIANNVFDNAIANHEGLRKYMNDNGGVISINDITKARSDVYTMIGSVTKFNDLTEEGLQTVTVDTFTCSFPPMRVFELCKYWKSLAKAKDDILFTYEEDLQREFVGTAEISFENASNAKLLANSCADGELRPVLNMVLLEINATSGDINFVSLNGYELGVISNNPSAICTRYKGEERVFQALFGKNDWKRICDYARKTKSAVTFEIYERGRDEDGYNECTDTMVAVLGETKVKSQQKGRFPNWKTVLPEITEMIHFSLSNEDVKEAQKWLSKVKAYSFYDAVNVTAYKGSDLIYFDIDDNTRTFKLSAPSNITIGTKVSIKRLQSKKFCGFHLPKFGGGIIVDDANCDLMLVMPMEGSTTPNKKDREVIRQTAMVVEMAAA